MMRIYIDESGNFSGVGQPGSPSVMGALVVPDYKYERLMRQFRRLRRSLPQDHGEVKGRLLNEDQLKRTVNLLRVSDCLYFAIVIEMGMHSEERLADHQLRAAQNIVANLSERHHPNVVAQCYSLKEQLERTSTQLYVQTVVMDELLASVLTEATIYFAQRVPSELGRFEWTIDAKGNTNALTPWEELWTGLFMPWLQSHSLKEPMLRLNDADYSHFERFEMARPDFLPHPMSASPPPDKVIDLRKLFEGGPRFRHQPDHELELVDIVTNGLRRAFKQTLTQDGWECIRTLMIKRRPQNIQLVNMESDSQHILPSHYGQVISAMNQGGRSLLI